MRSTPPLMPPVCVRRPSASSRSPAPKIRTNRAWIGPLKRDEQLVQPAGPLRPLDQAERQAGPIGVPVGGREPAAALELHRHRGGTEQPRGRDVQGEGRVRARHDGGPGRNLRQRLQRAAVDAAGRGQALIRLKGLERGDGLRSVDAAVARQDRRHAAETVPEQQRLYRRDRIAIRRRDRGSVGIDPQTVEGCDAASHKRRQLNPPAAARERFRSIPVKTEGAKTISLGLD